MAVAVHRFDCMLDPLDAWTVWDCAQGAPAELLGECLFGLSQDSAQSACRLLNQNADEDSVSSPG